MTGSFFRCGTNYELYIVAVNDFGESAPSETVKGRTGGKPPRPPVLGDLILTNTTWVALNLGSWDDGLCPISSFVVEYQLEDDTDEWHLVSNNVRQGTEVFPVYDLQPLTTYTLRVTAHNSAGSSTQEYSLTTLGTGSNSPHMDYNQPGTHSWRVVVPLLGLFSLLLAGGVYMFHRMVRQLTGAKITTAPQSDLNTDEYHQLQLYHQPSPCMVHQAQPGYSTPVNRVQGDTNTYIHRSAFLLVSIMIP